MRTAVRVLPLAGIQGGVGRGLTFAREAEETAKAVEWIMTAVETEGELIEICLKVLRAYAVVRSPEPRLEIREYHVDDWQIILSDLRVIVFRTRQMFETSLGELSVTAPTICHHHRAGINAVLHEATKRLGSAIRDYRETNADVCVKRIGMG